MTSHDARRRASPAGGIAGLRRHSALLAVALVMFGVAEAALFAVERSVRGWQEHSREVASVARTGLANALERDGAANRYLLSRGAAALEPAGAAGARLDSALDSLVALTADNPAQQTRARAIAAAAGAWNAGFVEPALGGTLAPAAAVPRDEELFAPLRAAFGEFLTAEDVLYDDRRGRSQGIGLLALAAMILPSGLLAGLVIVSGRRFGSQAEQVAEQQMLLEEQAVELEQQVQELELANTELAETVESERQAHERAEQEARERRRNAALLDAALHSAPIAMSLLDRDLRYAMVNDATAAITGAPAADHIGRTLREVNPGLSPDLERALLRVIEADEPLQNFEMARPAPGSNRIRHLLLNAYPIRSGGGAPIGLGVTAVDTTEQRELLEQFHHAQKLEAVGRLAAGIAHDFNNLITIIRSYCDLVLLELPDGAPIRAEIGEIRAAGERAAALSRQMLAMSRKQAILPRALAVGEAVREVEPMLRRVTGDTVDLRVDLDEPLGIVQMDPTQLEQVLMNLVINAVDAMPDGGTLRLSAANVTIDDAEARRRIGLKPGPHVALGVRDSGTGIPPDTLRKIFDPFFTTKPQGKGTGLGLSTVYGIVRDAGGHVEVESAVGAGTTFVVYLPSAPPDRDAASATGRHPLAEGPGASRARGPETVLVVDDEDALRGNLARILTRRGYAVLQAAHGGEAMRVSSEHRGRIDLVLSDFHMPGMHGRDLVHRLHADRPTLRVLFMSGSSAGPAGESDRVPGNEPFIAKPFTIEALTLKVRQVLDT